MDIRRIEVGEGRRLRDIRLRALSDTPWAFAMTIEAELAKEESDWEGQASHSAAGNASIMLLAVADDDTWVGMAGGYRPESADVTQVELVSMWIDPAYRGHGLGRQLVEAVVEWATHTGGQEVGLWVTRGNAAAQHLYEETGFRPTGDAQPLPSDPCKDETRMIRTISRLSPWDAAH